MGVSNTCHICKCYFNLKGCKLQTIQDLRARYDAIAATTPPSVPVPLAAALHRLGGGKFHANFAACAR
jgi:hypothetical protein